MISNRDKYQAIVLGNTNYALKFLLIIDSIDLLGVNIDKNLQFNGHVKNICTKVNNQVNVIFRFGKIVPPAAKCKIYKSIL